MNNDKFEQQLQRQSLRQPPAAWREEILGAAASHLPKRSQSYASGFNPLVWWRELVLPTRHIWTGLAAVWVAIGVVTVVTRDPAPVVAKASQPSPAMQQALHAQQQLRAELMGRIEPIDANRPKERLFSPRSEQQIKMTALV